MTFRNSAPGVLVTAIGMGTLDISDKTGLSGPYDFTLEYDPESLIPLIPSTLHLPDLPEYRPNAPDIFSALEKQLGLRLEKGTALVDVVVIDHLDREIKED